MTYPTKAAEAASQGQRSTWDVTEAHRELTDMAHGRVGAIPAELLAQHVMRHSAGASWPVMRGAMEALLRRYKFAMRDQLVVASGPGGQAVLGEFVVRRKGESVRPYATLLSAVDPLEGSCSCADYVRASLGLCKHLLVVVDHVYEKSGRLDRARKAQQQPPEHGVLPLRWDPICPLLADADPLARLCWQESAVETLVQVPGAIISRARRWFAPVPAHERWPLARTCADDIRSRLSLVNDLLALIHAAGGDGAAPTGAMPSGGARVEPALLPLLSRERDLLASRLQATAISGALEVHLGTLKKSLYPYQLDGVRRFLASGRLLLADDMGLGKTVQAIASCHALYAAGIVRRGIIVAPATLKAQWCREWQSFSPVPVQPVDGNPDTRRAIYEGCEHGFLIANYEQVLRDLPLMRAFNPQMMVLDEAQRIKNWATKTARQIKELAPTYRLVLTGTPLENRLEELASIMDFVDDMALEPKWRIYPLHLAASEGERNVPGVQHLDTLRSRLAPAMLRRLRREVLTQLPPRTDTCIPVPLCAEQIAEHDTLNRPIAQLVRIASRRPLTQPEFLRLMSLLTTQRMICNGLAQYTFDETWPTLAEQPRPTEALLRGLASPKLIELRELMTQLIFEGRKVVVFSQWRRMLKLADWAIGDVLKDAKARAVFFTGQQSQRQRTANIIDFHDDPRTLVMFASDAGGVGLNLQRAASCVISLELPWNPAVLEQRIGRVYRLGQAQPIQVYHLVSELGIESRISELVGNKRALFDGLFDGTQNEVEFDSAGSFLERMDQMIGKAAEAEVGGLSADETVDDEEDPDSTEELASGELAGSDAAPAESDAHDADGGPATVDATRPPPAVDSAPYLAPRALASMIEGVKVARKPDGGMTIDASPDAALALASMFDIMARMFRAATPRTDQDSTAK